MGLRIVSDEWVKEMERANECNIAALEKMTREHDKAVQSYRELRDSKDREIERLHQEIEVLKVDNLKAAQLLKQLRKAVKWYEDNRQQKAL